MNDIQNRVSRCFANVFPDLPDSELPKVSMASLARWDSIAQVTLLAAVAEEFSIDFTAEDFEELTSFALITDYVTAKVSRG